MMNLRERRLSLWSNATCAMPLCEALCRPAERNEARDWGRDVSVNRPIGNLFQRRGVLMVIEPECYF
jgi:hypothetical protein